MFAYMLTFIVSCMFTYFAERYYCIEKKYFLFFSFLTLFFPIALAALRAPEIGTDVKLYMINGFVGAKNVDFMTYFKYIANTYKFEFLYIVLNYIISCFTDDWHWLQMAIQLIMSLFIYLSVFDNRKKIPMWASMWVYYMLFYVSGFNVMRQGISLSISVFSLKYLYSCNWKKYILMTLVGIGFHRSAFIMLLIGMIYLLLLKFEKTVIKMLLVSSLLLLLFFLDQILGVISLFFSKYSYYIKYLPKLKFLLNPFLCRIPFLFIMILGEKCYRKKDKRYDFWIVMLIVDLVLTQMRSVNVTLERVAWYFGYIKLQAYPSIANGFQKKDEKIVRILICGMLLIIWIYQIVIRGIHEVYPYKSDILKWL